MRTGSDSCSSSIDSSNNPCFSSESSIFIFRSKRDVSTDLSLGSISPTSSQENQSNSRDRYLDWPPIKPLLRNTLAGIGNNRETFFVKVYMEGIPIGRKLDLFAHHGYKGLIRNLHLMFGATILHPDYANVSSGKDHVLTYEDKEGDWMMVGDVPWEMFLVTVKRLKITRADKCDSRELIYSPRRDLEWVETHRERKTEKVAYM